MYFVNLFGIGIRFWICDIPFATFSEMDKVRISRGTKWETEIFDTDFLLPFGITNWQHFCATGERRAFTLSRENRIEIKHKSKFIEKFKSIELLNDEILFPKYSTYLIDQHVPQIEGHQRMVLVHYEIGQFAKYEFDAESFHLENLRFILVDPIPGKTQMWLHGLELNGNPLKSSQNDLLFRGSTVYFHK
jgi:hypothetical protein